MLNFALHLMALKIPNARNFKGENAYNIQFKI
jgi:hypothetical protein